MELVRVNKKSLREIVQKNRDAHRKAFEDAVDGFRLRAVAELESRIAEVKKGRHFDQFLRLPEPEDHTKDYDRILRMLDLSLDDEIMLAEDDLQAYVMDDWAWKNQFTTTNTFYAGDTAKAKRAQAKVKK